MGSSNQPDLSPILGMSMARIKEFQREGGVTFLESRGVNRQMWENNLRGAT